VTDGHDGVLAAVGQLFATTPRQRCLLHKQRNVLNAIPRRERAQVQVELVAIWQQPNKQEAVVQMETFKAKYGKRYPEAMRSLAEEEEKTFTFYEFPQVLHRHIQTTNAIESLAEQCAAARLPRSTCSRAASSCLTIVWATIQDIRLHKISVM
jgi:putative transposase